MNENKKDLIIAKSFVNEYRNLIDEKINDFSEKYDMDKDKILDLKEMLDEIDIFKDNVKTFKILKAYNIDDKTEYCFKVKFINNKFNTSNGFFIDINNKEINNINTKESKELARFFINEFEKEKKNNFKTVNGGFNISISKDIKEEFLANAQLEQIKISAEKQFANSEIEEEYEI